MTGSHKAVLRHATRHMRVVMLNGEPTAELGDRAAARPKQQPRAIASRSIIGMQIVND